jgi:hypothetical protein
MWRNAVFSWILGKQAGYASEPIKFPPAVSNFPCCRQKKLNHGRDRPMRTRKFNLIFRHSSSLILTVLLYIAFSTAAHAKELWVDTLSLGGSCSDARAREEVGASTPWCSLDPAGDQAIAGDVVTVRKGTYSKVQNCTSCNVQFCSSSCEQRDQFRLDSDSVRFPGKKLSSREAVELITEFR